MTVELITGYAGTPHIGSADIGAFQAGIVGPGDYALATGNQLKATMSNSESHTSFIGFSTLKSGTRVPTVMPSNGMR